MKHTILKALAVTLGTPVLVTAALVQSAAATTTTDTARFTGTFSTACGSLPRNADGGAISGGYQCRHSATSVACRAIVATDGGGAYVDTCQADLEWGVTSGHAEATAGGGWACVNGSGVGSFRYQPDTTSRTQFSFPVVLTTAGGVTMIEGSYSQLGSERHIVVRASFPAVCAPITSTVGYDGDVSAA